MDENLIYIDEIIASDYWGEQTDQLAPDSYSLSYELKQLLIASIIRRLNQPNTKNSMLDLPKKNHEHQSNKTISINDRAKLLLILKENLDYTIESDPPLDHNLKDSFAYKDVTFGKIIRLSTIVKTSPIQINFYHSSNNIHEVYRYQRQLCFGLVTETPDITSHNYLFLLPVNSLFYSSTSGQFSMLQMTKHTTENYALPILDGVTYLRSVPNKSQKQPYTKTRFFNLGAVMPN